MPKQQYALEPGGPKRLEVSWRLRWKNTTVRLDGMELGVIPDQKALKEGQTFKLDDGSTLSVQLARGALSTELRVLRNGQPLPGSASDPAQKVATAYGVLFFVGGLSLVVGLGAEIAQIEFLRNLGLGLFTAIAGLVFIGLGFLVRKGYLFALILAMALYALDGILLLVATAGSGGGYTGGLVMHVIFLIFMYQGVGAMRELERQ